LKPGASRARKTRMKHIFGEVLFLCATLSLTPATSLAEPSHKAEALRHYDRGLSQMRSKAYGEAIAEFNQAYDLWHDFAVLYDIGMAYAAIEEPVHAIKALKKYLSEGGRRIPSPQHKAAEAEIARQEGRIATVIVHSKLDDVVLKIDGVEMGKTPLPEGLPLVAGSHLLAASLAGHRSWEQRLNLAGGDRRNLDIDLEPNQAATAASALPLPAPAASEGPAGPAEPSVAAATTAEAARPVPAAFPTRKVVAYVLGGVGIGALAIGGVYGVRALSKRHDSESYCPQNQC
jgi:hypothetical protein